MAFDRYSQFRQDGSISIVPFGEIPTKSSDFYETYKKGITRLDILSYNYYGDPDFGWLILQANPEYGSMEFDIPDNANIRIPYPLYSSLEDYKMSIENHKKLYL